VSKKHRNNIITWYSVRDQIRRLFAKKVSFISLFFLSYSATILLYASIFPVSHLQVQ